MRQDIHSEAFVARVRRLWGSGESARKIGEALGISKNAVIGMARRRGFNPRGSPIRSSHSIAPGSVAEAKMLDLHRRGLPSGRIAAQLKVEVGVCSGTVRRTLRQIGIEAKLGRPEQPKCTLPPLPSVAEPTAPEFVPPRPLAVVAGGGRGCCCYPFGERPHLRFCDAPVCRPGGSYCDEHQKLCVQQRQLAELVLTDAAD